jgi:predicted metal-dependent hydrolase
MDHQVDGRAPLIVAFVDELMSATRIEAVAAHLGFRAQVVDRALIPALDDDPIDLDRPGEPIEGPLAEVFDFLTARQPALLVFDLANQSVPWQKWLAALKSSPATRRFPVICYGPHVDTKALASARDLLTESDAVVARSRFFSTMPELFSSLAKVPDYAELEEDCRRPLSADALLGLEAFNRADYFESHEYLEDAWNDERGAARELYRAVLQVAIAYLQIERRNFRGAAKMFLRARQWLEPLPAICRGVDISQLRADAESARQMLVTLGPDQLDQFDLQSLQPVRYEAGRPELGSLK